MNPSRLLLLTGVLVGMPYAQAHSPYLLPNLFDVSQRDHVSVQASFTEKFFIPDVVMEATDWHVVGPEGVKVPLAPLYSKDVTILDVDTPADGTYRISTGIRVGFSRKASLIDGQWEFFEAGEAPAGAVNMQSITRADVYVSRGKPSDGVLAPIGKGLEFHLRKHPSSLFAGDTLRVVVLNEGRPLAGALVELATARDAAGNAPPTVEQRSDPEGVVELPLPHAGLYHVMTRHRVGPAATSASAYSYTVALTLEVVE